MALVSLQDVSVSFGGPLVLEHVDLQVEKGERVALIGRNGEGKTTLLRLIDGQLAPDSGRITMDRGASVAGLAQDLPQGLTGCVREVVSGRFGAASPLAGDDPETGDPMRRLAMGESHGPQAHQQSHPGLNAPHVPARSRGSHVVLTPSGSTPSS